MTNFKDLIFRNTLIKTFFLFILMIFFIIFSSTPIKFFSSLTMFPNIAEILLFYFFIINRDEIPYFLIFLLGILFDVFNNMPLGITAFAWLISSRVITVLRVKFYTADSFFTLFRDFVIFSFLNFIVETFVLMIATRTIYSWYKPLFQFLLDAVFFALFYKLKMEIKERNVWHPWRAY